MNGGAARVMAVTTLRAKTMESEGTTEAALRGLTERNETSHAVSD